MVTRERRFGVRVPLELLLDQYLGEMRFRALTGNVSETGIYLSVPRSSSHTPRVGNVVAMEFQIPGMTESIWASGVVRFVDGGDDFVCGLGIRFVGMARVQARALRDYCVEARRERLCGLLAGLQASVAQPTALAA